MRVLLVQLAYRMAALDRVPIGIDARGNQRLALGAAHLNRIVFDYLLVVFFCHVNSLKLA